MDCCHRLGQTNPSRCGVSSSAAPSRSACLQCRCRRPRPCAAAPPCGERGAELIPAGLTPPPPTPDSATRRCSPPPPSTASGPPAPAPAPAPAPTPAPAPAPAPPPLSAGSIGRRAKEDGRAARMGASPPCAASSPDAARPFPPRRARTAATPVHKKGCSFVCTAARRGGRDTLGGAVRGTACCACTWPRPRSCPGWSCSPSRCRPSCPAL